MSYTVAYMTHCSIFSCQGQTWDEVLVGSKKLDILRPAQGTVHVLATF